MADTTIDIRKKLDVFEDKIMGRVEEQCAAIAQEVEEFRKQELEKYLSDVLGDTKRYMESEINDITTSAAREVYTKKVSYKKELFSKRESYCQQVFEDARGQLERFVSGAEYEHFLNEKVRQLGALYKGKDIVLWVRPADLKKSEALKQTFASACGATCTVEGAEEITLGGVILTSAQMGYRVDESLDAALENQKQWFYAQSGMIVSL